MSWLGKVIGGSIGFAVGGPVGAAIGAGIGAIADSSDEHASNHQADVNYISTDAYYNADHVGINYTFKVHDQMPESTTVACRVTNGHDYVKTAVDIYADSDGDFTTLTSIDDEGTFSVYIPFGALEYYYSGEFCLDIAFLYLTDEDPIVLGKCIYAVELPEPRNYSSVEILQPFVTLCMGVMRAKGPLESKEIKFTRELLTSLFELDESSSYQLRDAMKQPSPYDWSELLTLLNQRLPELSWAMLFEVLAEVAKCLGDVKQEQQDFIVKIALLSGMPEHLKNELISDLELQVVDYYGILNLSKGATKQEIKNAYRKKISQYHPDKVQSLPIEFQELANQKSRELTEAYEILIKQQ